MLVSAQPIKKCDTCGTAQFSIILAWKSVLWPVEEQDGAKAPLVYQPAGVIHGPAFSLHLLGLMSDYHSCSCPFFFYCEDKCVTHSVITPPLLLFLLDFFLASIMY